MKNSWAVILGFIFYAISLCFDSFLIDAEIERLWANPFSLLITGWIGVFYGYFAWLANPLLMFSWKLDLEGKSGYAALCAVCALLFGLSFLLQDQMLVGKTLTAPITHYGWGYRLWLGSMVWMCCVALYQVLVQRRPKVGMSETALA